MSRSFEGLETVRPLSERWLAARFWMRRAQAPAGRYVDDVWISTGEWNHEYQTGRISDALYRAIAEKDPPEREGVDRDSSSARSREASGATKEGEDQGVLEPRVDGRAANIPRCVYR